MHIFKQAVVEKASRLGILRVIDENDTAISVSYDYDAARFDYFLQVNNSFVAYSFIENYC
jgi:hypothetical protein